MTRRLLLVLLALPFSCTLALPAAADDWPTYRHDCRRSGVSGEALAPPLSEDWVFTPLHPPTHAWGDPQPKPIENNLELPRLRFDDAFHTAAVGDAVYFGSSATHQVYALDAASGRVRWRFTTDGPVRMAPTVADGRVYVGSDDGRVYCLRAADGKVVWTFAAAPSPEMLIGNGRMISVWPVRTGGVVEGDVAYFGAVIESPPSNSQEGYACCIQGVLVGRKGTGGPAENRNVAIVERAFSPLNCAVPNLDSVVLYQSDDSRRCGLSCSVQRTGTFGSPCEVHFDERWL